MIASLVHVFPEARKVVDEHATEAGKALLLEIEGMSTGGALKRLRGFDIASFVDLTFEELFALPELRHVFDATRLGQSMPSMPVMVVQGVRDKIVAVEDVDALVDQYTAGGTAVNYHRDPLADHLLLYPLGVPLSLQWLEDRIDEPTAPRERRTGPVLLDLRTYAAFARLILKGPVRSVRRRRQTPSVGKAANG
jgi:triacylglycerol lipase